MSEGTIASSHELCVPKNKHKVPTNWTRCPSIADTTIANTFVVFKTPLNFKFLEQEHSEKRFTTNMVFSTLAKKKISLGLWIDLTNTDQYYDKHEVKYMKCNYVKLFCKGKKSPTRKQTSAFINICSNFIENNPSQKIGVHCTHGFNRTGFMIAAYLIEKLGYSVPNAIAEFAVVRPPGIFRQHLISALYSQYSNNKCSLVPKIPNWVIN